MAVVAESPSDPPRPPPLSSAPAPGGAASPVDGPTDLDSLWSDQVLPALSGLTKAMYQTAALTSLANGASVVTVENDHHRQNCERKRGDVEAALTAVVGQPVTVRIEVGGEGASAAGAPNARSSSPTPGAAVAPVSDDPDEHLAGHDVHDLPDAPDAPAGGLAALTDAFPGTELIEEP